MAILDGAAECPLCHEKFDERGWIPGTCTCTTCNDWSAMAGHVRRIHWRAIRDDFLYDYCSCGEKFLRNAHLTAIGKRKAKMHIVSGIHRKLLGVEE